MHGGCNEIWKGGKSLCQALGFQTVSDLASFHLNEIIPIKLAEMQLLKLSTSHNTMI